MKDILLALKVGFTTLAVWAERLWLVAKTTLLAYLQALSFVAAVTIIPPMVVLPFSLIFRLGWATALAGIWIFLGLGFLALLGSPLGVAIDAALQGTKGDWISRERYKKEVYNALLLESAVFLFLSTVPVQNHWSVVPQLVLGLLFLRLAAKKWNYNGEWFRFILFCAVAVRMLLYFISFYYPEFTLGMAGTWIKGVTTKGWGLFMDVPYHGWILLGAILALSWMAWKTWGSKSTHSAPTTSGHGGGKSLLWTIFVVAVVVYVLQFGIGLVMLGREQKRQRDLGQVGSGLYGKSIEQRELFILAEEKSEYLVPIPEGMACTWDQVHTNEVIWVHPKVTGYEPFLDKKGEDHQVRAYGPYNIGFRSAMPAGSPPVLLKINIHPKPNK